MCVYIRVRNFNAILPMVDYQCIQNSRINVRNKYQVWNSIQYLGYNEITVPSGIRVEFITLCW